MTDLAARRAARTILKMWSEGLAAPLEPEEDPKGCECGHSYNGQKWAVGGWCHIPNKRPAAAPVEPDEGHVHECKEAGQMPCSDRGYHICSCGATAYTGKFTDSWTHGEPEQGLTPEEWEICAWAVDDYGKRYADLGAKLRRKAGRTP